MGVVCLVWMSRFLPPYLLRLFEPRPPVAYMAPPKELKTVGYTGVGELVAKLKSEGKLDPGLAEPNPDLLPKKELPKPEFKARLRSEQRAQRAKEIKPLADAFDASKDPKI